MSRNYFPLTFALYLLFVFTIQTFGQTIDSDSPIDSISYNLSSNEFIVNVRLKTVDESTTGVPITEFTLDRLEGRVGNQQYKFKNPEPADPKEPLNRKYIVNIARDSTSSDFWLKENWSAFNFKLKYKIQSSIRHTPDFSVVKNVDPSFAPEIRLNSNQNLIWLANCTGTNCQTQYLAVQMNVSKCDQFEVNLFEGSTRVAGKEQSVCPTSDFQRIQLTPERTIIRNTNYRLEIISKSAGKLMDKEIFTPLSPIPPFELSAETLNRLRRGILVTKLDDGFYDLKVRTNVPGNLRLKYIGNTPTDTQKVVDGNKPPNSDDIVFRLDLRNAISSRYLFNLEGEGGQNQPFMEDNIFLLNFDKEAKLKGNVRFTLEDDKVRMGYTLDRDVLHSVKISAEGTTWNIGVTQPVGNNGVYSLTIDRTITDFLRDKVINRQDKKLPVTIELLESERTTIASFVVDAFGVTVKTKKLEELFNQTQPISETDAKTRVAEALGFQSTPAPNTEDGQVIDYLAKVLRNKEVSGKDRFKTFLRLAGNVTLKVFGIPIQI